jgi:uncharacterized membrane protein YuzA (DUF378 family)
MNGLDRGLRIVLSLILIYIGFINTHFLSNMVVSYLVGSFGVLNLVSALIGFCPVYFMAHLSTYRETK